ncbi:hypothetical protein U5A82_02430 [Sphingobium sp. CR2-8]|nr:hypothetical protein [Sphingobium sp. CR2-8]MEC3909370.1 hypothetical protein [Sphingobium sp. CR2-8]
MHFNTAYTTISSNPSATITKIQRAPHRHAPTGVLPLRELRRIVAEMLG